MKVTLVVATYNGEETLDESLRSLNSIELDGDTELSIIYINNNSNDLTPDILSSFKCKHPFYTLSQEKRGKNAALNTIFNNPQYLGELLIFSDDDIIFPSDFVSRYKSMAEKHPDVGIFGGRVDAKWPRTPSEALLNGVDKVVAFAITPPDWGYKSGLIDPTKIHGPNMAVRASLFEGVRFNESIGPNGGNYMMGSETELLFRFKNAGIKAFFDFDNAVKHIIHPYQLDPDWLASRAYKAGRSMVMHQIKNGEFNKVSEILGYPRWAIFQSLSLKLEKMLAKRDSQKYFEALWRSSHLKGYSIEYKNQMRLES